MLHASDPVPVAEDQTALDATAHAGDEAVVGRPMNRGRVLGLAIPIIGENLLHTLVMAVDTIMVSQLGAEEVAGVGTAAEMVWFLISMLIALDVGATVLVAQAIGAREHQLANTLARQAIVWGVILAVPVSIAGYVAARPVVGLFGTEPEVADHATTFLHITTATSIVLLLTFVSGAVLRGAGDSRTPLHAAIAANVVNVIVSWMLIFGQFGLPKLGVAGSAWGAASARAVSAAILLTLLASGRRRISIRARRGWRPDLQIGKSIFRLGIPAAVQDMVNSAGFMVMVAVVAMLGTASLAAQQIGFTALSLAFMPGIAFGIATTALVGQSVGAKRPEDARIAVRISARWSMLWMATGGAAYFLFADDVMRVFTTDPEVVQAGTDALRALAIGLPFWSVWFVYGGALRGMGDTRSPMVGSAIAIWGAVGLAYLMVSAFDRGLGTVWLSFLATAPLAALSNWIFFRRRMAAGISPPLVGASGRLHK